MTDTQTTYDPTQPMTEHNRPRPGLISFGEVQRPDLPVESEPSRESFVITEDDGATFTPTLYEVRGRKTDGDGQPTEHFQPWTQSRTFEPGHAEAEHWMNSRDHQVRPAKYLVERTCPQCGTAFSAEVVSDRFGQPSRKIGPGTKTYCAPSCENAARLARNAAHQSAGRVSDH